MDRRDHFDCDNKTQHNKKTAFFLEKNVKNNKDLEGAR